MKHVVHRATQNAGSIARHGLLCTVLAVGLAGCSGLTQIQDSMTKFDQGAHSISTAQMTFFRAVQTAECETQFYSAAYDFSREAAPGIDLRGTCNPQRVTDSQITIRQNLMNAVTLYADQLQALAAQGDDKNLDTNAQTLARNLNSLAKAGRLASSGIAADAEAAVMGLTGMVLDHAKFRDIRAAANSQKDNLSKVVRALTTENTDVAAGIDSNLGVMRSELTTELLKARKSQGNRVFFSVIQARSILQAADPFGPQPVAASAGAVNPATVPQNAAQQLNTALNGLVAANNAIATAGTGGIVAAVSDLVARAQQAQADQAALSK